eukprot:12966967-Alexandrium_andersonii.AAC.1
MRGLGRVRAAARLSCAPLTAATAASGCWPSPPLRRAMPSRPLGLLTGCGTPLAKSVLNSS